MIRQLVKWKISGRFPSHPRNSIRENFNSIDNPRHQIFPKIISPKIFSGTSTKDLSTKRDERPVRDIPQMPHRTFHRIPASNPNVMQPTRNPSSYQPAPSSTSSQRLVESIAGRCSGVLAPRVRHLPAGTSGTHCTCFPESLTKHSGYALS